MYNKMELLMYLKCTICNLFYYLKVICKEYFLKQYENTFGVFFT